MAYSVDFYRSSKEIQVIMDDVAQELRNVIELNNGISPVWEKMRDMIFAGTDRDLIFAKLEDLRLQFRSNGREQEEDMTLEAMDYFVGWCAPMYRL